MATQESIGTESASRRDASGRLRLVAFTAGPLTAVDRIFLERLARDSLVDLAAIVVDESPGPRKPLAVLALQGLREDGLAGLAFTLRATLGALILRTARWLFELAHRPRAEGEPYETLERRTEVRVYRLTDIQDEASLSLIRSLQSQLGVVVGGRRPGGAVTALPEYGTLILHKGKTPTWCGEGPVGYCEILAGDSSLQVSVRLATDHVDAGAVLAKATIPIDACDTLESLRIKADLVGARVYHEAVRGLARGQRRGVDHDLSGRVTHQAPSALSVWRLERRLRRRAATTMPLLRSRPRWLARARIFAQYIVLLPLLLAIRTRLIRLDRAPLCILFYHVVANRPVNHMCLPLEEFVRQIEFLRRYYALVSLPEVVQRVQSGGNGRIAISITFDDGYSDNAWAVEYLRYFEIPACFFVSIGHVRDGTIFEHDRDRGYTTARPFSAAELRQLATDGFIVGSHGIHHEDFGRLGAATAEWVLRESRDTIGQICGRRPEHFSFPKGHPENIMSDTVERATRYYACTYSASGGYCFPHTGLRHFPRVCHPVDLLGLAMITDGYTSFRACLTGNAWGLEALRPTPSTGDPRTAAKPV